MVVVVGMWGSGDGRQRWWWSSAGLWYCWGGGGVATLRQRLGCVLVVVGWALPHSGT